jgi:stearoyl-CoA desaturase (delta-9 desaturase)
MQLVLALLAMSSAQQGVLWWAAHHRRHHRFSDTERDVHSPRHRGFWYSHLTWIWDHNETTNLDLVRDLARYPELRWLDRHWLVPPTLMGIAVTLWLGWDGLFIGFLLSTVLVWHATLTINSLSHMWGTQRYDTGDDSRNNLWLALLTFGEGWHNNHHHYMLSARQGFRWWEVDLTWWILCGMSRVGLVWDLKTPPAQVLETH